MLERALFPTSDSALSLDTINPGVETTAYVVVGLARDAPSEKTSRSTIRFMRHGFEPRQLKKSVMDPFVWMNALRAGGLSTPIIVMSSACWNIRHVRVNKALCHFCCTVQEKD